MLLKRASVCYERAGLFEEAIRVSLEIGDDLRAAAGQEHLGLMAEAAQSYAHAASKASEDRRGYVWREAARCYGTAQMFEPQAEALLRSGDALGAAWVRAHFAHLYQGARALLTTLSIDNASTAIASEVVHARCEAGTGLHGQASRRLNRVLGSIGVLMMDASYPRTLEWTIAVSEVLGRYDLGATAHSIAAARHLPEAIENWQRAAKRIVGTAAGVPARPNSAIKVGGDPGHE
jgi:hypothetical protein